MDVEVRDGPTSKHCENQNAKRQGIKYKSIYHEHTKKYSDFAMEIAENQRTYFKFQVLVQ